MSIFYLKSNKIVGVPCCITIIIKNESILYETPTHTHKYRMNQWINSIIVQVYRKLRSIDYKLMIIHWNNVLQLLDGLVFKKKKQSFQVYGFWANHLIWHCVEWICGDYKKLWHQKEATGIIARVKQISIRFFFSSLFLSPRETWIEREKKKVLKYF